MGGQSVSCKASLATLRLYGYFVIFVVLLSENKYDDDNDDQSTEGDATKDKANNENNT